jgi:hypothetical protein
MAERGSVGERGGMAMVGVESLRLHRGSGEYLGEGVEEGVEELGGRGGGGREDAVDDRDDGVRRDGAEAALEGCERHGW